MFAILAILALLTGGAMVWCLGDEVKTSGTPATARDWFVSAVLGVGSLSIIVTSLRSLLAGWL
jgi:hypothetical protein